MEFLHINVLIFLLIPILIFIFLIATKKNVMQKLFPQHVLEKLLVKSTHLNKRTRNILLFCALILMTFALARPVMNKTQINIKQEVTPIIVAIDVSKSMLANDVYPTRLAMAKNKLQHIIKKSSHNALGVLLFAKSAFILSPITQDFSSLSYLVENFDNGLNFDNGSNIYALIEAANKLFKDYNNKNLLILSDGANKEDYAKETALAKELGISIYALGIATSKATPIKVKDGFLTDKNNNIVTVKLNEHIKQLALNTNGGYIAFSLDNKDLDAILKDIEQKSSKDSVENQKHTTYVELFYYPLALALLLILIAFSSLRKSHLIALLSFCMFFSHNHLNASLLDFKTIEEANKYYEQKQFKQASQAFKKVSQTKEGHYNYANALYKNKQYDKALEEYKKVITSNKQLEYKKLHNMGNAYVKLAKLEDAVKMYEKALRLQDDQQTKENLQKVQEALKQQSQQQKSKQQQDNKKDNSQEQNQKKNNSQEQNQKKSDEQGKKKNKKNQEKDKKDEKAKKDEASKKTKENDNEKNKASKDKFQQHSKNQEISQKHISDLEEKKWMQQLQKQKTPVLLRKVDSKSNQEEIDTPW